jgi:hypothetical protein
MTNAQSGRANRRAFLMTSLAAGAAIAVPVANAAAGSPVGSCGSLVALGAEFEEAWAAERAADMQPSNDEDFEAIYQRCSVIAQAIPAKRAASLADFRVKVRALLWCYSGDSEEMMGSLFPTRDTTDVQLLHSIVADLLAISEIATEGRTA